MASVDTVGEPAWANVGTHNLGDFAPRVDVLSE